MKRIPDALVNEMRKLYETGASLSKVARTFNRERASIREIFRRRKIPFRPPPPSYRGLHRKDGTFQPYVPKTPNQVRKILRAMKQLKIPRELAIDWRYWPLSLKADFIRAWMDLNPDPCRRPQTLFSSNVKPFDYGTEEAWKIANEVNVGLESRKWTIRMKLNSQGVIWKGRLWFWCAKVGYASGPWNPKGGRPLLHKIIWEQHHRRKLPPHHVLRFKDGNRNNLLPGNLELISRNVICRENQAKALQKKSRDKVRIMLARAKGHHADTLAGIRNRQA